MRSSGMLMSWLLVLLMAGHTWSFPGGPPDFVCKSMKPSHGADPQTVPAPFTITTSDDSYTLSQPLTVTITATDPDQPIKGFLVQARRADPTLDQTVAIGTMTAPNDKVKVMCPDNQALSHVNATVYNFTSITFNWTAPGVSEGHIKFRATIVVVKTTYWMNVESLLVSDPNAGPINSTSTNTSISVAECGKTKGCMRVPDYCTSSCDAIVTWRDLDNGYVEMELGRKGEGWVGGGFSHDNKMADTSVVECIRHSGYTVISQSKNVGYSNTVIDNAQDGLSNMADGYIDGNLFCRFQRKKLVTDRTTDIFDLNNEYFLLLAHGAASDTSSGGKSKHSTSPSISPEKVAMDKYGDIGNSANVVRAHDTMSTYICVGLYIIIHAFVQ